MTEPFELHLGDCLEVMRGLPDESVDAVVTDPPYELGFMGKAWDKSGVAYKVEVWQECLRLIKPGGHLLAFGGSRTYHRLACAVEDAGFEIRDQIQWIYGSGFPKSLDVSKAIDKAACREDFFKQHGRKPNKEEFKAAWKIWRTEKRWADRYHDGGNRQTQKNQPITIFEGCSANGSLVTLPVTPQAQQWAGWGTALKPAHEPLVLARKPLVGTVIENVLVHGPGALNVDGCRVEPGLRPLLAHPGYQETKNQGIFQMGSGLARGETSFGRWPANVVHDGSEEVLAGFPETVSGNGIKCLPGSSVYDGNSFQPSKTKGYGKYIEGDSGSAARFFYCAKASRADRDEGLEEFAMQLSPKLSGGEFRPDGRHITSKENASRNHHPTVKPTDLMRWLCRLVTPPGGLVLDPFMGSGSTGKAALKEGFRFVGIEIDPEYMEIASRRIQPNLFSAMAAGGGE